MTRADGHVVVEFAGVVVALLLPLSYLSGACWEVARTQLALRTAAHAASRAYVLSPSAAVAARRVGVVSATSLQDAGVAVAGTRRTVVCSADPCLSPGGYVTVRLSRSVSLRLPGAGTWSTKVSAADTSVVDVLR